MATYSEIAAIQANPGWSTFVARLTVAVGVKAYTLAAANTPPGTVPAAAVAWAREALASPDRQRELIQHYILARYRAASIAAILAAPDEGANSLQEAVSDAVDTLLGV